MQPVAHSAWPRPRQPMFWAALAFSAGILFAARCWRPPLWLLAAAVVLLLAGSFWLRRRCRLALVACLVALSATGAVRLWTGEAAAPAEVPAVLVDGREIVLTGHVVRDALTQQSPGLWRQSLDVRGESAESDGAAVPLAATIRLTVFNRESFSESAEDSEQAAVPGALSGYRYGQRIRFPVKLRLPRNYGDPGVWDYRGYLASQGVSIVGAVRADKVEVLPGRGGTLLGRWRNRARMSLLAHIHRLWPGERAGLMEAMLIGEAAEIDRDTSTNFQRTGAYHLLVVSGMNLAILATAVFWLLRRLKLGEATASLTTAILAVAYAYLAGAGSPIIRAALMLMIYLGARLLYRDRSPLNAVGAAAFVVLAFDPTALFSSSFQLTFLAVTVIAGIAAPLLERTLEPYRRGSHDLDLVELDARLPPRVAQFRLDLRLIAEQLGRLIGERTARWMVERTGGALFSIVEVLIVSALMQLSLALPMAAYFHRATVVGLPANALAVPLNGVLMPAGAAALALDYAAPALAPLPAMVATWALDATTGSIRILGTLRVADVRLPSPSLAVAVTAMASIAFGMFAVRRQRWLAGCGVAALVLGAAALTWAPGKPDLHYGVLELTTLDVGQAESHFIATPDGHTLLVDAAGTAGPTLSEFDFGEQVISPYLWSRGIRRLDAVALSHTHSDHIGGMPSVVANFRPRELWLGPSPDTPALRALLRKCAEVGTVVKPLAAGDAFTFGEVQVRVLWPPRDWPLALKPNNNESLVLRLSYGKTSMLLTGDAEKKVEAIYAANPEVRADVLKVAHNGSLTATTPAMLAAVSPRYASISAGFRNNFHHPRPEILQRLADARTATYRTDTMGAVTFYLDGTSVTARTAALR